VSPWNLSSRVPGTKPSTVRSTEAGVGMVEHGERLRFALEARQPFRVGGKDGRQDFQRDIAIEVRVAGEVDLAHAASAELGDYFVGAESRTGGHRHGRGRVSFFSARMGPHPHSLGLRALRPALRPGPQALPPSPSLATI